MTPMKPGLPEELRVPALYTGNPFYSQPSSVFRSESDLNDRRFKGRDWVKYEELPR